MSIDFHWHKFNKIFPFADLTRSQGEYQDAVVDCLEQIKEKERQEVLLNLLDMQWMARLEQIWVANEHSNETDYSADTVAARLQINSNIRHSHGLEASSSIRAMNNLGAGDTLSNKLRTSLGQ